MELVENIVINYFNPSLNIGLQDIRNAWFLSEEPLKLSVSFHRGTLVYHMPESGKRISYRTLKKGLVKKKIIINQPIYLLPF